MSNGFHLVMAVAMAVMAWPRGAELPTKAPMLFFLAATLWFLVIVPTQIGHRLSNVYHAAMMLAMAWMYAVMSGGLLPQPSDGGGSTLGHAGHHGSSGMPGMDMSGESGGVPEPPFITALNWLFAVGFAVAAIWWLYALFVRRREDPDAPAVRFIGITAQVMMAAGMAIMFGVML
ncbi:DUF5134 domain-containing protein [Mycolicibacterium sp. 050232]|uniref:DUF5134 domain-containing protein n=1 Tax=Mycolicibacterium sp. 050232 TaxID=3113982 RepID=UPI002E296E76|nr:DUF5134 domain-containing protein [Mycolicibacterium sp. 050232]MED5813219.1 DUF5134 domain-containing protein [Mycolicibacterium sp. 050232]